MAVAEEKNVVVVFDFDKTIIDCDSDNWVVDQLGLSDTFQQLAPSFPWNSLMDRMMMELHSRGKTVEDIAECLRKVPLHPSIISAIKSASSYGCDLRIVSDANEFFIETVLKHHGLIGCFSEIYTNPSFVDDQTGRLRVLPYHDFSQSSHGCHTCPPNMCKGQVMDKVISSAPAGVRKKSIVYLGDGAADFCAGLKLGAGDFLLPRKNFPIWDLIHSTSRQDGLVKAEVCGWSYGVEFEKVLMSSISCMCPGRSSRPICADRDDDNDDVGESVPMEYKFETCC